MLGLILIIFLVLFLVGGLAPWGSYPGPNHGYGYGTGLNGGVGLVLVIVLIFVLLGRF